MKRLLSLFLAIMLTVCLSAAPAEAAQNWRQVYQNIEDMINKGVAQYKNGDIPTAKNTINDSYYGIYEKDGFEKAVRTTISSKNANVAEYQYSRLKKAIREDHGAEAVENEAKDLLALMQKDLDTLEGKGAAGGRWASFWPAFLILLREGMEAILMLVAIVAYLSKSGNGKYLNTVYNYATAAVVASFATAYVFSQLMDKFAAGASQELIEGITALVAVAVLLSVSLWMSGKTSAQAWKNYIEGMMKESLTTGRARALGFAAFLAVYREGAEVILFYQALFNNSSSDTEMIWFGFGAGCVVLLILYAVIQFGLLRIPLRPFFIITSALMFLLAVTFAGSGVSELQEAGVVSQTFFHASWFPNIDWLGMYPTWETCGVQLFLLAAGVVTIIWRHMQNSKAAA
ncbi:MAG: FTR1 family iron permease [Acidaminococcaceae bacterium]|nr:FTR1 family iron permease [Acidaminococcaceae bacterium]